MRFVLPARIRQRLQPAHPETIPADQRGRDAAIHKGRPSIPECPEGWVTGPPDFVIAGAEKAGTTRWRRLMSNHPMIHGPARELHWFDQFFESWPTPEDGTTYERYFPRPPGHIAGEKSPSYMRLFWVPAMLREAAPDTRIILILRDPLDRYISGRAFLERFRTRNTKRGMTQSMYSRRAVEESFTRSQYADQVESILEVFPREQLLVLQFEACNADPLGQIARTFEFVGVPPHVPSEEALAAEVNVTKKEKVVLDPRRERALRTRYRTDALRLQTLVPELDLSLWPSAAEPTDPSTEPTDPRAEPTDP
ncbi:MAG: sulfotransferase [Chloroflexi bacterium]|nr:sulfotransferase [Chloroflexota bacterium]